MKLFKKHGVVNSFLRERPKLYDLSRKVGDAIFTNKTPDFILFQKLNQLKNGSVKLVQIGANDGLRNDPIRDFMVRNDWFGILVEPLPYSFEKLKSNYAYLNKPIIFENVAIGADGQKNLEFWTFSESFLAPLGFEQQEGYHRKSSFSRDHVIGFLPANTNPSEAITAVGVEIVSVKKLLAKHEILADELNLLAVDAEGFDQEIIKSTLDDGIYPDMIYFESHHTGDNTPFNEFLIGQGYNIIPCRRDTFAIKSKLKDLMG